MVEMSTSNLEGCLGSAVVVFGDKWTPLLVDALSGGALRFCQLQDAVGGVNPRTLSSRLVKLESEGILCKAVLQTMPPHTEYRLTEKGFDVVPILRAMREWSTKYPRLAGA